MAAASLGFADLAAREAPWADEGIVNASEVLVKAARATQANALESSMLSAD